jgi:hypothetical protein
MFEASTSVQVGNGTWVLFWSDRLLDGASIDQLTADVVTTVSRRALKTRSIADTLQDNQWIRDISGSLSISALNQYVLLWSRIQTVALRTDAWAPNQQYSSSSAYRAFFIGQSSLPGVKELSKTRATPRCKFFI